jgi:transglutaminase-like putative cysteine protease/tetratricopeptide (TPR) repeat protein
MFWRRPLVVALIAVFASSAALAQEKEPEKAAPTAPDFSKEAYTIELLSNRISVENDGTGAKEVTAGVKILADAGVKAFAVLNFIYTSANEVVEIDYVRVRKPDGTVVKTPDYNIQDMPAEVSRTAPLYSDIHEKHVAVKGLGVGDVLEYLVRYRTVKAEVPGHFWYEYSFAKDAIAKDEHLELSVPSNKYVKVASPEFKPEIKEEGTRRVYRWIHANLQVKENDPNEVPRRVPLNPDIQVTTFANWEEIGRWYGELQKGQVEVTPAIQAKAAELTKGLTTDEEKTHAIYNFVSLKFHYIGLDFGIGRYQPHAADDVLDNGYGDCKDKHTLLASLLKAAGIEAWPALIHVTRRLDVDVPSPAQFNHVITVVPRGDKFLWLDTTPEVAPYGLLLLTLRDKQALVIPSGKPPVLMTTPRDAPFPQEQKFSAEGKLSADGTFTAHMEQFYRGDAEVIFRAAFRQVSQSQWKEAVQRFSYSLNFGGDVSNVTMTAPDDLDKPFQLSYDYIRKNYADWDNRQITAPLPPIGMEVGKGQVSRKPQEPVLLGGLGKVTYHSRVELPSGYVALAPGKCHLVESYAEYTDDVKIEKDVMTTDRELVVKKPEVPLSDWDGFEKFGRAVYDDEFNYIRLVNFENLPTPAAEIEDNLRKLVKDNPNDATAVRKLGEFLFGQGKYPDAVKVLEAATATLVDSALEFDLGQSYLKNGDHEKALAHMRDAIEIKDDDPVMLNNIAYVLAENNTDLGLAREYAEKALDELDDESQGAESSDEAELRLTYEYGLVWDTLGWIYFQQGDAKRAEALIRAAWLLNEDSVAAEHLAEVHEKEGKNKEAAREYEYALVVAATVVVSSTQPTPGMSKDTQLRETRIRMRYKKLTGKAMDLGTQWRLPNGEWTPTPAEQLMRTREFDLANHDKLAGSARFNIEVKPEKLDSVRFISGEQTLMTLTEEIEKKQYLLEFPPDSGAILMLRLEVKCTPESSCTATLVNPIFARR